MKNKKSVLLVILIIIFCIIWLIPNKEIPLSKEEHKINKHTELLSMMLEQTEGVGDYKLVTQSDWPTDEYIFNSELSKCENGGELSWDDTKKIVVMSGNVSDKCYVYFDVETKVLLVNYIKSIYTGTQGENNLYFHDSSLSNGAKDNSYRYAGPSDSVNNFICFGTNESPCSTDNLYRIIGVIDGKVKLIKYDYMTTDELGTNGAYLQTYKDSGIDSTYKGTYGDGERIGVYYWNNATATNTWSESNLNNINLNTNFINYLGSEWSNKIASTTWKVKGNTEAKMMEVTPSITYQNEIVSSLTEYEAKVGLMYLSEYGYAASPNSWTTTMVTYSNAVNNNWIYMGLYEWTLSRDTDHQDYAFIVFRNGNVYSLNINNEIAVRVAFNLESSITYKSGIGSINDPILIN